MAFVESQFLGCRFLSAKRLDRQNWIEAIARQKKMHFTLIVLVICTSFAVSNADAFSGDIDRVVGIDIALTQITCGIGTYCVGNLLSNTDKTFSENIDTALAQIAGGISANILGNILGYRLLDLSDEFPPPALSSWSVVMTSFAVSVGTSAAVYEIGQRIEDDSRSFSWTLTGGFSAVGLGTLGGMLLGLKDDWQTGAAIGSVAGRYLVPICAIGFYYLHDNNEVTNDEETKITIPMMTIRF